MKYDVIIVGAGPSGSYSGYLLSKAGVKVLIIDKENFPRDKVCGGGISQKTLDILDFDISPIVQRNIKGAYLTFKNSGIVVKSMEGRNGVSILRSDFDNYILQKAIEQGADFLPKTSINKFLQNPDKIILNTSEGEIESRILIAADGVYSKIRREVFGNDLVSYAPAIEALIYVDDEVLNKYNDHTLFDFGGMKKGYGWIFPKKDHLNVGVFSIYGSKNIKSELDFFIKLYPSLGKYKEIKTIGFSIPVKNNKEIYGKENLILIGDAAGFAESFYGEGIYFALKSGKLAAEAIINQNSKSLYSTYKKLVSQHLEDDLFYSRLNAQLFFTVQKFGYYYMVKNKFVNHFFAELIGGKVGYKECFYKTLASSPYWIFSSKYNYEKNIQL